VYSREIDGEVLTLSASGWTYKNTFILYDYETESMWYHFVGQRGLTGITGKYVGRFLPELVAKRIRWNLWVKEQPDTKHMACKRVGGICAGALP
jgi:hypothetical protein